jgi:hypothetical protein
LLAPGAADAAAALLLLPAVGPVPAARCRVVLLLLMIKCIRENVM